MKGFINHINILLIFICLFLLFKIQTQDKSKTLKTSIESIPYENTTSTTCSIKTDLKNMMYQHPDFPLVRGRPFSGLETHSHILQAYLDSKTVELNPEQKIKPQPVTGISSNHFAEHQANAKIFFRIFPNEKVLFVDLGLTEIQSDRIKSDDRYIYKKFDFEKYPEKTTWLTSMAFKVFSIMECLMVYQACMWWDASIKFTKNYDDLLENYVYGKNSSFVYYIKPAGHTVSWATHPLMFSYLPSNITRLNLREITMSQGGATIIYNTVDLREGIMKWAIACALTPECLMPNYELTEARTEKFGTRFNPWGHFELKHCSNKYGIGHPFVCHRFDQSLWMILVANHYNYDTTKYRPPQSENIAIPDRTAGRLPISKSTIKLQSDKL